MNVTRAELIQSLQNVKTSLRPDDSSLMEASAIAERLRSSTPKKVGASSLGSDIKEQFKKALGEGISIEKEWRPRKSSIKSIIDKVLVESSQQSQNSPNAMRLNLQSMVLDKSHAKFSVTRNGIDALVELLYPNVNEKITVKVSVKGADDNLVEVGLEDQSYLGDFGAYILTLIDATIIDSATNTGSEIGMQSSYGSPSSSMSGYPDTWVSGEGSGGINMWESDGHRISSLMTLVEEEEENNEGFNEDDFAIDAGASVDIGDFDSNFGGNFGSGFGGSETVGDVNADNEGAMRGEPDDGEWSAFRDKSDWLQSSLDGMQKLTSNSIAQKMQQGSGVILTSDEIMNGSVGLKNDMPVDIMDKFLNVYPELDNIEMKESDLDQIEEKLSLDDGQFDAWLQQKLPEIMGQDEVSSTLDNEMFEEFGEMGGDAEMDTIAEEEPSPEASFEEFLDDINSDSARSPDEITAEREVDLEELPELPNL